MCRPVAAQIEHCTARRGGQRQDQGGRLSEHGCGAWPKGVTYGIGGVGRAEGHAGADLQDSARETTLPSGLAVLQEALARPRHLRLEGLTEEPQEALEGRVHMEQG